MARSFVINGEVLVRVKSVAATPIGATLTPLGLAVDAITVTPNFRHSDIEIDAFGGREGVPPDVQWMLADAQIDMTLVHFDNDVLRGCLRQSMGQLAADGAIGSMARAGTLMGQGLANTTNRFIQLYLSAPIAYGITAANGTTWYFPATYLTGPPVVYPLGVRRSEVQIRWRAIPFPIARTIAVPNVTAGAAGDPATMSADGLTQYGAQDLFLWNHTTTT